MARGLETLLRKAIRKSPRWVQTWVQTRKMRRDIRRGVRLVPPEALQARYAEALELLKGRLGADEVGDYYEFGVYNGTSLACMDRASAAAGLGRIRLFGFDSFEGLPDSAETDDGGVWHPGQFRSELEFTREFLTKEGVDWGRITLVKGWFSETLTPELVERHRMEKAGVIMVDCDMYISAKDALAFVAPLIRDLAVIFFDDWNSYGLADKDLGEKRAYEEFLADHPFSAEDFPAYSPTSKGFVLTCQT